MLAVARAAILYSMQQPIVFRSESRREIGDRNVNLGGACAFCTSAADAERLASYNIPRTSEWLYYPRELAAVLHAAGVPYEIHCHSGDVVCGWRMGEE